MGDPINRDLAIGLFEKIAKMRPEEPQSFRDLGLALADRDDARLIVESSAGNPDRIAADGYVQALTQLNKVVMNHWDRFDEIEVIALMEANRIIAKLNALEAKGNTLYP